MNPQNNIEHLFEQAKSIPMEIDLATIETMVSGFGVGSGSSGGGDTGGGGFKFSSFFNLNSLIMFLISSTVALVLLLQPTKNENHEQLASIAELPIVINEVERPTESKAPSEIIPAIVSHEDLVEVVALQQEDEPILKEATSESSGQKRNPELPESANQNIESVTAIEKEINTPEPRVDNKVSSSINSIQNNVLNLYEGETPIFENNNISSLIEDAPVEPIVEKQTFSYAGPIQTRGKKKNSCQSTCESSTTEHSSQIFRDFTNEEIQAFVDELGAKGVQAKVDVERANSSTRISSMEIRIDVPGAVDYILNVEDFTIFKIYWYTDSEGNVDGAEYEIDGEEGDVF